MFQEFIDFPIRRIDSVSNRMSNPRVLAIFLAILSSVLSSIAWIYQGAAVGALTPLAVASVQAILTGIVYIVHLGPRFVARIPWSAIRRHQRELAIFVFLRCILGAILINLALELSGSIKVMFFTKLEPYFVIFWFWLLRGQLVGRSHLALLLVHVFGAILLSVGGDFAVDEGQFGDLLIVCAIGIISFSQLYVGKLSQEIGPAHLNGVASTISGFLLLPLALWFSPAEIWNFASIGWLQVIIVVLLFNVFAMTMWYAAMRDLEAWLVSALRAVGPVFAAPIAWLFFNQTLGPLQIFGALIVLATSAWLAKDQKRSDKRIKVVEEKI